jgi:DHA2 family multidrug resistance protein
MSVAATAAPIETAEGIPQARRIAIMVAVVFAATLYATTLLIASVLLPQMQGAMGATQDEIAWVMTFNILATAVMTPMTGWLVARFGRRGVMLGGISLFTGATLLCGLSESLEALVLWRIVQGASGAPVVPLTQTILLDTFPRRQHGTVTSIFGMAVVIGPVIGPTLGGYLAEMYDWRWAFFMIVPVGVLAVAMLSVTLSRDSSVRAVKLDWTDFLAIATTVVALQLVLSRGQRLDWFESREVWIATGAGIVAFYIFIAHSLTTPQPFIDLRLLKDRNYALGLLLVTFYGMLNFTPMVLLPPLLQTHAGWPDSMVGEVLGARGAGAVIGFFAAMFVGKLDPRIGMSIGYGLLAWAGWGLMHMSLDVGLLTLMLNSVIQGVAVGLIWVPLTIATFATLPPAQLPQATAIFHLLRNIGSSAFISVCVALIVKSTGTNRSRLVEHVAPGNEAFAFPGRLGAWDLESLAGLAKLGREVDRQAAMIGYLNGFGLFTLASAAAIPLILMVRPKRRA